MNYLDLFSGIGGFALGAHLAGMKFENHYFSEIEKYPVELYQKRFPDAIGLGDITKINCNKLPAGDWIITGGFPCQDISCAGKGAGIEGKRSGLWFTYADIIGKLRPKFAIMENVGALTIRGLDAVLGSLTEIGYNAEWQDIRAEDMGAPHKRERIWIVAYPSETISKHPMRTRSRGNRFTGSSTKMAHPIREQNNQIGETSECRRDRMGRNKKTSQQNNRAPSDYSTGRQSNEMADTKCIKWIEKGQRKSSFSLLLSNTKTPGWWTIEPDVGRVANGVPDRVDRLKGLGNSIIPQIAELLFNQIKPYV